MIEFERVRKTYFQGRREVTALADVTLRIERGEFVAVMGPSGSGKSTLLHLAGGLDLPNAGIVRVAGAATATMSDDALTQMRRERLGFVFQFFNLIPTLRVIENVAMPLLLAGARQRAVFARVDQLLDRVQLSGRRDHFPEELSGGEMQRVAIARALVIDPMIVLADEPTGNLDSATGAGILELLREVAQKEQRTVAMVTHDEAAARYAQRVIRLRDGRVDASSA